MKLRILDDSIRLRLSRSDVVAVDEKGVVDGRTRFPDGSVFTYVLVASSSGEDPSAAFENGRLVVTLPAADINAWAGDDEAVSLGNDLELGDGQQLKLLVEKDFQCVTPREGEDQSDLFVNPEANC